MRALCSVIPGAKIRFKQAYHLNLVWVSNFNTCSQHSQLLLERKLKLKLKLKLRPKTDIGIGIDMEMEMDMEMEISETVLWLPDQSKEGGTMLIEIFTDGRVMIDGQLVDPSYKPESVLMDYITNPKGFIKMKKKSA